MKPVEIKKDVYWVGAVDWDCRDFHGYAISPRGTTYNSFVIKDEKVTLFDTVKDSHRGEFLCRAAAAVDGLENIDYIVVNHLEQDHSGVLEEAIERIKPEKIFCSPMGDRAMKAIFHYEEKGWPVEVKKTGESLSIGKRELSFLETRMLHWPDNMATYIEHDKLLISSDAFGQNWATTERFADEVDRATLNHLLKEYFANIVQPFSPTVLKTLDKVAEMGLDIDMIVPDHGLMWRGEDCAWVMDRYRELAHQKPPRKLLVLYDTMWHSTEHMAASIAEGARTEGVPARVMSLKANHHSTVMTELLECGAVAVGSPTHNNGVLPDVAAMLQYMKGLKPQNKIGGAFGSYGWSGESVKIITSWLEEMKMEIIEGQPRILYVPDHDQYGECFEYGRKMAKALLEKTEKG